MTMCSLDSVASMSFDRWMEIVRKERESVSVSVSVSVWWIRRRRGPVESCRASSLGISPNARILKVLPKVL